MARFINPMKKLVVLLIFLLFATTSTDALGQDCACKTDSMENYPPNPHDDRTEPEINALIEFLKLSNKQTIKNTFDEWILQNPKFDMPSIIINSKNITFTKFMADEDIVPISSLAIFRSYFDPKLYIFFENIKKVMQVDGTIQFFPSGNYSSCQIAFKFNFKLASYTIYIFKEKVHIKMKFKEKNFTNVELDEKLCKSINEEQRHPQSVYNDMLQATEIAITERINFIRKSAFRSISNNLIHPRNNSYARRKNNFSLFIPHSNIGTFPWLFDYNEFIIDSLEDFSCFEIIYLPDGKILYEIILKNVKIRWNIASVTMMQLIFEISMVHLLGSIKDMVSEEDFEIRFDDILQITNHDYITDIDEEFKEKFQVLIANGIKQAVEKIQCDDSKKFTNDIQEILRPFDEKLFEKSLVNFEEKNSILGTIFGVKLDIEAFHLKNITWLDSNKLEVGGTLSYERIKGQADISLPIEHVKVHNIPVSVKLFIKEAIIGISLSHSNNLTNNDVQINPNWNDTDTTVTITSNYYHLSQKERTAIGKQIFQYFIKVLENQIIEVTKSTFCPIFDIYKNSFNNSTFQVGRSNDFNNQRRYFAKIRDYWSDKNLVVEIIINGFWYFNPINIHYVDGELSINGLELKNITASIKQLNNLNNSVTTNYSMSHFSLTINHAENDICVNVLSHDQNVVDIVQNFKSTVASFIGYLIYGNLTKDSVYHTKSREFVNKTTTQVICEDTISTYDKSSQFATNFVYLIVGKENTFYDSVGNAMYWNIHSANNDYISNETTHQVEPLNVTLLSNADDFYHGSMDSMIQNEFCVHSNNSLTTNKIVEQLVINGKVNLWEDIIGIYIRVPFIISRNRVMNVTDDYYNETTQFYIDDTNIKDTSNPKFWTNNSSAFDPSNKTLKTVIVQKTSSFLHDRLKNIPFNFNFCKPRFGSFISPEKYFFLIAKTINYPLQLFSIYHIKLYGLQNFKTLCTVYSKAVTKLEITITNVTARIIWNHYIGDYIRRTPEIMNLQIHEIMLCAKISLTKGLLFTSQSRLLLSSRESSIMVKILEERVELIVINEIQQAIQREYTYRINEN